MMAKSGIAAPFAWLDWRRVGIFFAAVTLAVGGLVLQGNTHLNHDLSWVLYSAGEMLNGAVFGRDVIAANPPLAWYLAMPAVGLADALAIHSATAFRGFVAVLSLASLAFAWRSMSRTGSQVSAAEARLFLLVASYIFFVGSYRDFGQREYLALVLVLPYLLVAAARMDGRSYAPATAIAVGLAAGIGFALKPYFLAVPLLVELLGAIRARSLRVAFRCETFCLASFFGLYAVSLPLMTPDYVFGVVPAVRPVYWGFNDSFGEVLSGIGTELLGFATAIYLAARLRCSSLQLVLLAAAGGFLFSYLVQMKGYTYHGFPFRGLVALSLAMFLAQLFCAPAGAAARHRIAGLLGGVAFLAVVGINLLAVAEWYGSANRDTGDIAAGIDRMVALVDRHAAGSDFLALSTHPYPGFPTAIYASANWGAKTNSRIFLPAVAKLRHAGASGDGAVLRYAEQQAHGFLRHDLAMLPRLILVDGNALKHGIGELEFDILAFYLEDPEIRARFDGYRELKPLGGIRVFVRRREGVAE